MKIYVFPADQFGCGMYRLIWPAQVLRAQGHDVQVIVPKMRDEMLQGKMNGDVMVDVRIPADADVIVFQRVTHRHLVQAISLIRKRGVAVVVDFDDDLTCIHPANPAFGMLHPRNGNRDHSWENTLRAADAATLVTVSTPALIQRYGRSGNGHVLYNMVPERMLRVPHTDHDVIGWGGSIHSHPTDLQAMGPAIAQLLQAGHRFKVAGNITGIHDALGIPTSVEIEATGAVDIDAWPLTLASIGVGVAPLADTKFNSAKSWLKMAEMAAVGVPCVGSARAEYVRINKMGVGLIAKNTNDWRRKLADLIGSVDLRHEVADRGREVMYGLTIEENAWRWVEAWADAFKLQRSTMKNPLARVVV